MKDNFVHLHAHTSIGSMQDAMTSVDDMFARAKKLGQPALAITDHGTMAAVFDARKASLKHGVKYIPGCETYFVNDVAEKKTPRYHLVLLAKNEVGFKNLLRLNYIGYKNFQYIPILRKVFPRIDWNMLKDHKEGLVCLTACGSGPLARALFAREKNDEWHKEDCYINALKIASQLKDIFGENLYLEIQPHDLKAYKHDRKTGEKELDPNGDPIIRVDQPYINRRLLQISKELEVPLVATCDVHYLNKEDAQIHDMLMAINEKKPLSDKNRHRYEVEEFYMKSFSDVKGYFSERFNRKLATEVCNNTVHIANQCEDSSYIDSEDIRFPVFDPKTEDDYEEFLDWKKKNNINGGLTPDKAYMRFKCIKSFNEMYGHLKGATRKEYKERIIEEIKVFEEKNFSSYMLITSDFICKARARGIRVGPGRGSVGGSLVANLLGIHEVDPVQYGLLFERFLNRQKTAFPDIDTDFSPNGRDWVENYIIDRYGTNHVAHVSNLSTITPKVVIKDIARSLELGGSKSAAFKIANAITDSIPSDAKTFDDALNQSPAFRKYCAEYPDLEKYGRKLVGLEKNYATHAAGIVISDIDLTTYVPLRYDKDGTLSVQYEKERCEKKGLIKMDLLGLEHLKVLDSTIVNARKLGHDCPEPHELAPFDDKDVWDMISKGNTICVFQMGSHHMRALCKRIKPQNIEDLSLVNALGRPSAAESRDIYIGRRDGKQKVEFRYKFLEDAFQETLGICVYEEQLAKLAKYAAQWNLNKADGLRKLTKLKGKDPKLANQLEHDFIEDTMKSGLTKSQARDVWKEIIEPFAGYGFNKAHGIFYSLNGYHTAYYKYHYPAPFMAGVLKSEIEKTSSNEDKIKIYKNEAKRMGIKIIVPDVNVSGQSFSVRDDSTIVMGLAAVKGVGAKAVQNIIETREEHPFKSFGDFLYRTNSRVVQKKVIQCLAKAGCFDSLGITRRGAHDFYDVIRTEAKKHAEKRATLGLDPWNLLDDFIIDESYLGAKVAGFALEWNKKEILEAEGATLGEYISGDINDLYEGFFTKQGTPLKRLKKLADGTPIRVEAVVEKIAQPKTKTGKSKGKQYGNCTIVDRHGTSTTMKVWSNVWGKIKDQIKEGRPIRALCRVNIYKGNYMIVLNSLEKVG